LRRIGAETAALMINLWSAPVISLPGRIPIFRMCVYGKYLEKQCGELHKKQGRTL